MLRELHKQRAGVTSPLKSQQGAVSKKSGAGRKGSATWGSSDLIVAPRPSWVPDKNATDCYLCAASFSIMNRRHHCRQCGNVFCGQCTRFRKGLPEMGYSASNQLRVCFTCYALPVTDSIAAAAKRKRDAGDSGQSLYTSTARQRPSQREATSGGSSRMSRRNPTPPPAMPKRSASAPTSPASSPHPSPPTASNEQHHQQHQEHTTPEQPGKEERGKHVMNADGSGTGAYNPLILDGTALRRESRGDRYEQEIQPMENEREEEEEREEKEGSGTATTTNNVEGEAMSETGKTSEATLLPSLQDSSPLYTDPPPSGSRVPVHSRLTAASPVAVPPLLLASLPTKAP